MLASLLCMCCFILFCKVLTGSNEVMKKISTRIACETTLYRCHLCFIPQWSQQAKGIMLLGFFHRWRHHRERKSCHRCDAPSSWRNFGVPQTCDHVDCHIFIIVPSLSLGTCSISADHDKILLVAVTVDNNWPASPAYNTLSNWIPP